MNEYDREQFLLELKLGVEEEYNAPGKPEDIKNADRNIIKNKVKTLITSFCKKHNATFQDIKEYILSSNNETRGVNPSLKEEYDLIEEILNYISEEQEKESR